MLFAELSLSEAGFFERIKEFRPVVFTIFGHDSPLLWRLYVNGKEAGALGGSCFGVYIVKACIEYNAANIILMHNHPSGEVFPSSSDDQLTRNMVEILKHIDVHVHDHIIVAGTDTYSYAQHNRLPIAVTL